MKASIKRSQDLVENVMDLARSRLVGGITLNVEPERDLHTTLTTVVEEIQASHPDRMRAMTFDLGRSRPVDHSRVAQLLSNLLGNALTHGDPSGEVRVIATAKNGEFELALVNAGEPI